MIFKQNFKGRGPGSGGKTEEEKRVNNVANMKLEENSCILTSILFHHKAIPLRNERFKLSFKLTFKMDMKMLTDIHIDTLSTGIALNRLLLQTVAISLLVSDQTHC